MLLNTETTLQIRPAIKIPYRFKDMVNRKAFLNPNSRISIPKAIIQGIPIVAATPKVYICMGARAIEISLPTTDSSIAPVKSFCKNPKAKGIIVSDGNPSQVVIMEKGFIIRFVRLVTFKIP